MITIHDHTGFSDQRQCLKYKIKNCNDIDTAIELHCKRMQYKGSIWLTPDNDEFYDFFVVNKKTGDFEYFNLVTPEQEV